MATVQTVYDRELGRGQLGWRANFEFPFLTKPFPAGVPTTGATANVQLEPGMAVRYDETNNDVRLAATVAERLQAIGIITFDKGAVQATLPAPRAGTNTDQIIRYANNDVVQVATWGVIYGQAGGAIEPFDRVVFQGEMTGSNRRWVAGAAIANVTSFPRSLFMCFEEEAVASGALFRILIQPSSL